MDDMKREVKVESTMIAGSSATPNGSDRRLRKRLLNPLLCSICATFGIFGGLSSLLIGLVCVLVHAAIPNENLFDRMGTVLLISGIPLILLGSIFIDQIENKYH